MYVYGRRCGASSLSTSVGCALGGLLSLAASAAFSRRCCPAVTTLPIVRAPSYRSSASTSTSTSTSASCSMSDTPLKLDKRDFDEMIEVAAVVVNAKHTSSCMKRLKPDLLNIPKRRNVELVADRAEERLILLRREAREEGGKLHGLSEDCMAIIHELDGKPTTTSVSLSYNDFSAEQVLQRLLGNVLDEVPGAFETAGHIAHLNLREAALPYKHIIAQVILDKNNHIQTVVNKIGDVGSEFRTFPMEVLAGDDNTIVDLREGGCRFQFDFRHVYWNSRLQMEHGRLVKSIVNAGGEVVCDMMAGVGPFAVPLAKSGLTVYANDLNPQSYKYLALNAKLNKIEQHLHSSNMCGREHVRSLLSQGIVFQHVIMNLPANAIDFLDAFRGVCWADAGFPVPPQIHCYCFSREKDKVGDSLARVNEVLGSSLERNDIRVHLVRDVAPNKAMLCVSFQAPEAGPEQASKLVRSNGGDD